MSEQRKALWTWIARVVVLLGMFAGILAAAKQLPAVVHDYAALAVSLLSALTAWIYSFLPNKDQIPQVKP